MWLYQKLHFKTLIKQSCHCNFSKFILLSKYALEFSGIATLPPTLFIPFPFAHNACFHAQQCK